MTRTVARELAMQLGFAVVAGEDFAQDSLDTFFEKEHYAGLAGENPLFEEFPDKRQMRYIRTLVQMIFDHRVQLDAYIQKYASGWRVERISKTAAAIMRTAMCEILYMEDVPGAAAINEAVELAKRYDEKETAAFINGVLGAFVRGEAGTKAPGQGQKPERVPEPKQASSPKRLNAPCRRWCRFRGKCMYQAGGRCRCQDSCRYQSRKRSGLISRGSAHRGKP